MAIYAYDILNEGTITYGAVNATHERDSLQDNPIGFITDIYEFFTLRVCSQNFVPRPDGFPHCLPDLCCVEIPKVDASDEYFTCDSVRKQNPSSSLTFPALISIVITLNKNIVIFVRDNYYQYYLLLCIIRSVLESTCDKISLLNSRLLTMYC